MAIPPQKMQEMIGRLTEKQTNNESIEELIQRVQQMLQSPTAEPLGRSEDTPDFGGTIPIDPADSVELENEAQILEFYEAEGGEEAFDVDSDTFLDFAQQNPGFVPALKRKLELEKLNAR